MSDDEDDLSDGEPEVKVVLIGKSTVGKTSIINYAICGSPSTEVSPTVGANFSTKRHEYFSRELLLQMWDTAGQERFRSMTPLYYRGAHVVLLVFAVNDRASFDEVDEWSSSVSRELGNTATLIIVGNKCDLSRTVTFEDAQKKAASLNANYVETCAITGAGITTLFDKVAEIVVTQTLKPQQEKAVVIGETFRSHRCC
jgi:Ras-related protein Rab-5C